MRQTEDKRCWQLTATADEGQIRFRKLKRTARQREESPNTGHRLYPLSGRLDMTQTEISW
jgi:hypothetical protein